MCKKFLFLGGGACLLATLLFGTSAVSYVWTGASRVTASVRDNVPLDFEIDRARDMVKELVPDIRRNMHVIAREEVEVERLEKQIADGEEKLGKQKNGLVRLQADVASDKGSYHYAGRRYTLDQVKTDLASRFARYKTNDATLASLRDILVAREKSLDAARQKLDGMLVAKRQLEVEVENLEARLKMVEVAQTTSDYNFDDSQLARVKDLMADIHSRLGVAEKLVNSDHQFEGEIDLDDSPTEDIAGQVAEYFELDSHNGAEVAEVTYH